jgi:hypothetical protein
MYILIVLVGIGFLGIYHDTKITNDLLREILKEIKNNNNKIK